ncbi:class I SAM-dependent methyltransferase [Alicyclobacillus sp. ALC3]|uniref:class I SAM-dependent methyltransferase n=1 Tax=Alicyclobacillus sp. ALC3 TaxID=2796143 RepID=UPI0019D47B1D|nr:methyltransferase domain-containing protein [Alicyclobacillus sp. ALC3]QSO53140.1 methyltransferase domain-containing protein [Alicyclobacillus curvatus]WDL96480.1 methyltransferase domain-containing protein [Alicyclobacillus sp. ALC3]
MFIYPDLTESLQQLWALGLVISPWLADVDGDGRFDPLIHELLNLRARECAYTYWTENERAYVLNDLAAPERMAQVAVYEIAASTAVYMAHETTGQLEVDKTLVLEAMNRVESFIEQHRFGTLLQLYMLVTSWENHNALRYYGEIPERDFVRGTWHRPWVDYSLGEELMFATLVGNIRLERRGDRRFVRMTDEGQEVLERTTAILETAGYFRQRLNMLRVSQFNLFDRYEQLAHEIWPYAMKQRQEFLQWVGIQPDMQVLELGCANGVLTFDGGLVARVGPSGFVVAVDPAVGMLARARLKQKQLGVGWVSFRQGRAEELPIEGEQFDVAVGTGFLHFTDRRQALSEMKRGVRPGGTIASMHPLKASLNAPFFQEWFKPILELAAKRQDQPKDYLLDSEMVRKDFADAGLTDIEELELQLESVFFDPVKVVEHFIRGVGWFGEELSPLPWQAREDLIQELIDRGQSVCERYSKSERIFRFPMQAIKARVPTGGSNTT